VDLYLKGTRRIFPLESNGTASFGHQHRDNRQLGAPPSSARRRISVMTHALVGVLGILAIVLAVVTVASADPPEAGNWNYTTNGPSMWNQNFPDQCSTGSRQSPFIILSDTAIRANLPKLVFHYSHPITFLDHDDQISINHGEGNYITIGKTRFDLKSIHQHTPAEYTIDGAPANPLEFHLVHASATGQIAVVGVLVKSGKADKGVIQPPSFQDPDTVEIDPRGLLPKNRAYWRFNGSLTTPTASGVPFPPYCAEGILWTEMRNPITMSADQIAAFEDSNSAVWGTSNIARGVQPSNNRFILIPSN